METKTGHEPVLQGTLYCKYYEECVAIVGPMSLSRVEMRSRNTALSPGSYYQIRIYSSSFYLSQGNHNR